MKVLVTGGAGFIGSHLSRRLLSEGEKVVVIDNFDPYYSPQDKKRNISDFEKNKNFKLYKRDIFSREKILDIFKKEKFDVVIHLAARAGVRPSIKDPVAYYKTNIAGTLNLLEASRETKVKNFVFGSSSSVYGERDKVPFSESDEASTPISPYGLTKLAAEKTALIYHNLFGIPVTCLRFFTVYGPGQRPDLAIRKFVKLISEGAAITVFGDGSSMRDYTYIDDIVDGIMKCYKKPLGYEIINLGNSNPVKLSKLISVIEESMGKKAEIISEKNQDGDVSKTYADIKKAEKLLGWKPKTGIEEGIKKTVDWLVNYQKTK